MVLMIALLTAGSAKAQQVMDGSDKNVGAADLSALTVQLIKQTPDPYSAQLIQLRHSPRDQANLCGMINLKNTNGGYTGFQPFIIYGGTLTLQSADQCDQP